MFREIARAKAVSVLDVAVGGLGPLAALSAPLHGRNRNGR
jgi:hypothetical protein